MRKIVLEAFGGPEGLVEREVPEPELPSDGYLIRVEAAGLNFAEIVERRGKYRKNQKLPYEIGKEVCGTVLTVGPKAPKPNDGGFAEGDSVIVIRFGGGCWAELVAARPGEVLAKPAHLSAVQGAAFAISFATAWYAQEELARARAGEGALIQAAAGGTGTAAVALAKARGLGPVFGTAGSDEKCALLESLGVDHAVNSRQADFAEVVREATGGAGVGYCLESVGGDVFDRSVKSLGPMGRLVLIGFSSVSDDYANAVSRLHPLSLFHRSLGLFGLNVENLNFPGRPDVWKQLVAVAEEHSLVPHVGQTFELAEAGRAQAAIEARQTTGKVVLVPEQS